MTSAEPQERWRWLRWIDRLSVVSAGIGGVAVAALMLNIVADILSRAIYNHPVTGTLDISQFVWMPVLVSLALGFALLRGEHIRVNLLTGPTGPRTQRVIEVASMIFTLATIGMLVWFNTERSYLSFGETGSVMRWLPIWPSRWIVTVGLIVFFLQAVASLIRALTVAEFVPDDADEAQAELESNMTVFDELESVDDVVPGKANVR